MISEAVQPNASYQMLARVAVARGGVVITDAPTFRWRKRTLRERLTRDFWQAWAREPLPPVGDREIRRSANGAGREVWHCSPATAANINALLSHR